MPSALELAFAIKATNDAKNVLDGIKSELGELESAAKGVHEPVSGASTKLGEMGGKAEEAGGKAEGLGGKLGGLAAAAGGVGAALGAGKLVGDSISEMTNLGESVLQLQHTIGGSTEDASRLKFAFGELGISSDQANASLGKFSKSLAGLNDADLSATQKESAKTVKSLESIGIAMTDQDGNVKSLSDLHQELQEHFGTKTPAAVAKTEEEFKKLTAAYNDLGEENIVTISGSKTLIDNMEKLGISGKDASGNVRPMKDVLGDLADKFKDMPDGAEKTTLAMQLFGKSGKDLIPFLDKGKEGIDDLMKESDKLGLTLSGSQVDAIHKLTEAHRTFDAAMEGVKVQIGLALLPVLTKLAEAGVQLAGWINQQAVPAIKDFSAWLSDKLQPVVKVIGEFIQTQVLPTLQLFGKNMQDLLPILGNIVTALADKLRPILKEIIDWFTKHKEIAVGLAAALVALVAPVAALVAGIVLLVAHWKEVTQAVEDFATKINQRFPEIGKFVDQVKTFFEGLSTFLTGTFIPAVQAVITGVVDFIKDHWAGIKDLLTGPVEAARDALKLAFDNIKDVFTTAFSVFGDVLKTFGDLFSGKWGKLWDDVKQILTDVWNGIKQLFGDDLDGIKRLLSDAWDTIKAAVKETWEGIKSLLGDATGGILGGIKDGITGAWDAIKTALGDAAGGILGGISDAMKSAWNAIKDALGDAAGGILGGIKDGITAAWDAVKTALGDAAGGTLGTIKEGITGAWDAVKTFLGDAAGGVLGSIKDGITGAFEAAKTALGDAAGGILGGIHDGITNAWNGVKTFLDSAKDDILHFLQSPFESFRDNIGGIMRTAINAYLEPLRLGIQAFDAFVGGVRDAVNWVSDKLGLGQLISGSFSVPEIPQLASGTAHFSGGLALVGEEGPELVHLPAGAAVLPAGPTQALRESGAIPGFFLGLDPDKVLSALKSAWDHIESFAKEWLAKGADKLVDTAFSAVGLKDLHLPGVLDQLGGALGGKIKDGVVEGIKELLGLVDKAKPQAAAAVAGAQTSEQVAAWIRAGMQQAGVGDDWFQGLVFIQTHEDTTGDPGILGNDPNDPNNPPVGLFQVKANIHGYTLQQLQDPVLNTVAAIEYIKQRYGRPDAAAIIQGETSGIGYALGGVIGEPITGIGLRSGRRYSFGERGPETVTPGASGAGGLTIVVQALDAAGVLSAIPEIARQLDLHLKRAGQPGLVA